MNVLVMLADQLRVDCLGCYGNTIIKTPNIDSLADRGVKFNRAFAQHPQCVPSRSSLFTGRYPHSNGSISNFTAMNPLEKTLSEHFRESGYETYCVGKLHLYEQKESEGFIHKMMCGGQHSDSDNPETLREDYKYWLKNNGYWEKAKEAYAIHATDEYWENYRSNTNPIPYEAYIDTWVGDRTVDFIKSLDKEKPFFMFVGFPNPHIPFDAPEPYASMYNPDDMIIPETFSRSLSDKPPQQKFYKKMGRKEDYNQLDESILRRVMAYYYGSISLVDEQVGKILKSLTEEGLDNDTVVLFVSDHGELLGHYGMLIKSVDKYPMLYDAGLHVPFIMHAPGCKGGSCINELIELVDFYPTVADISGLEENVWVQGLNQKEALYGGSPQKRDWIYFETGSVKGLRSEKYKLVYYPGQNYGELYEINIDPLEVNNLYQNRDYKEIKDQLIRALLDKEISTEGPVHGESKKGSAFWKKLYTMPFEY